MKKELEKRIKELNEIINDKYISTMMKSEAHDKQDLLAELYNALYQ